VGAGRSLLRVLDIDSLDAEGRQWLLGLDDSHRLPTLTYVQRAYRDVGSLATSDEREAVTEYVERLSPHLESEEAAGDREGELVEWGTLFETEPIEFRTLSKLRDLLEEH
jgi:hypothetical protein